MKFGIQTILWGHQPVKPEHYDRMFHVIQDAGFRGVELFQHPTNLPDLGTLLALLKKHESLELLGLSGGTLDERVTYLSQPVPEEFKKDWKSKHPYLYIDWANDREEADFIEQGFRLALHPHYLKKINNAGDAAVRLNRNPRLWYIPDSAHLTIKTIKREDIRVGLSRWADRLAAVHLKDWRPGFGRASALYARGFTELGKGIVRLDEILKHLRETIHYEGWIVVEQDYTEGLVESSVQEAAAWLSGRSEKKADAAAKRLALTGFHAPPPSIPPRPIKSDPAELSTDSGRLTLAGVYRFRAQRFASRDVGQLYQRVAEALTSELMLDAAVIWSCSELDEILTLQGLARWDPEHKEGVAVENADLTVAYEKFDGVPETGWLQLLNAPPSIRESLKDLPQKFYRLAVKSTWNPHHTRIVVDFFSMDLFGYDFATPQADATLLLSRSIAQVFDSHLDRIAFSSAADLNLAAEAQGEQEFGLRLKDLCRERLQCEAVAIFLTDPSGTRLKPFAHDELNWFGLHPSLRYYEKGDGQKTTDIWMTGEPCFQNRTERTRNNKPSKCVLVRTQHPEHDRVLQMPIVNTEGKAIGLVRAVNKLTGRNNVCNFSDDDLVVLDYILQQALPTLQLRTAAEEERKRVLLVAHELKRPVSSIFGDVDLMLGVVDDEKGAAIVPSFIKSKIRSAHRWTVNLRRLVLRSSYLTGKRDKMFAPKPQRTTLLGDIVAPTIAQLRVELRELSLPEVGRQLSQYPRILPSKAGLWYDDFGDIPPLYVDKDMFQQVFFNLLDNAIKYAKPLPTSNKPDPDKFNVVITTEDDGRNYIVRISDNGVGISSQMDDRLFILGSRGPDAWRAAEGAGVGLWLVTQLIELHGGSVRVEKYSDPTTIRIDLPHRLLNEWSF